MRLLVGALLVLAVVTPVATVGAQTSGVSFACPASLGPLAVDATGGPWAGVGYVPGPTSFLLPQMANGGLDVQGRTVFDGSLNGFPIQVWVDSAWTGGSNVTLTVLADYFCGGSGRDVVRGGNGNDSIHGFSGDDKLNGQGGNDFVYGGAGDDTARGAADNDFLFGDDGNDRLFGKRGVDVILGGPGNDTIKGGADIDLICGGGPWRLDGGPYAGNCGLDPTVIDTGDPDAYDDGVDMLNGEAGNDTLYGGSGADTIKGGSGSDVLVGDWDNELTPLPIGDSVGFLTVIPGYGADTGVDGIADLFDGGDMLYCGSAPTNLDLDVVFGGGGTDTSQNDCEVSTAEIQLA